MTISVRCPKCDKSLKVREDHAGRKVRCNAPTCDAVIQIPAVASGDEHVAHAPARSVATPPPAERDRDEPPRRKKRRVPCPECGEMNHPREEQCRECGAWMEEDDDSRIRGRAQWRPCPRCGEVYADRVTWTAWGSFYGPALFSHVRCRACKCAYNGKTGRSNIAAAILFVTVPLVLILGIVGFVVYTIMSRN